MYNPDTELPKIEKNFQMIFNTKFSPFYDRMSSNIYGHVCIDLDAFLQWLKTPHNEANSNFIERTYGTAGIEMIIALAYGVKYNEIFEG